MDNKKYIAKKVLKFMIKWLKPKVITAIACCVVIIFFASIVYYLNIVDGENRDKDMTSTPYAVTNYTKSAKITSEGIDITKSPQELWDEMIKAGNNVKEYLKSPEELEKLMNAEIVTQYPKIGKGNLDGIIQFERNKSDGKTSTLTYVDSATFSNYINNNDTSAINYFTLDESGNVLIATVDTTTEELTKNEDDFNIGQYTSTLSEDNKNGENAYKKTETKVISKPIDYKAYVQKYTMPFDFLWALLVIGEDKDFVLELADLVQSSQITISIYDNITTTVNKDTFTYNKEIRTDTYAKVKSSEDYGVDDYPSERYWADENAENYDPSRYSATYSTDDTEYNITHTTTTQTNTPIVDLTKADVWITNFSKEYEYQASKTESQEEDEVDLEETAFIESKNSPEDSDTNPELLNNEKAISLAEEAKKYIEGKIGHNSNEIQDKTNGIQDEANGISVDVTYVKNNYYERNIKGKQKHDSSTSLQKYISGTSTIVDKTEKNSEEKNFVTLLCSHKDAKSNILEVSSWLFEILESNDDTKNMVDLTKYLLYKASGIDYGVKDYSFSIYESTNFSSISSFSSNILFDYLASWESGALWNYIRGNSEYSTYVAKFVTEDKSQYICYSDYSNTRNFGFGVCHSNDSGATYWHVKEYAEEGISIDNGQYNDVGVSKVDAKIVDNVKSKLLTGYQSKIKSQLQDGGILNEISQEQIDSLTCIMYQYGNIGNFVDMYKEYGNTEALRTNAKSKSGKTYFNSDVESNGRSEANWRLFNEGKYIAGNGEELKSSSYTNGGKIIDVASNIWKNIATSGKFTTYGGISSIPSVGPTMDCSGFVSWVLYEAGYKEEFYYQHDTRSFYATNWNQKYGWEEISVASGENPINKLQPGDIFVRYGGGTHHVNIVASIEDGKLMAYDCGNASNWLNSGGNSVNESYFLTETGEGKIIRVTNM